jgi:hypothetical protein
MLITICGLLILGCEKKTLLSEASTTDQEFEKSVQKTDVFHENFHEPVEFTEFFDCAGEEIHFSGYFHWNYHTVFNANGDFHSVFVANDHSLSGVGLTTGTKYHEVGATVEVFTFRGSAPFEYNFEITFDFIGQGPGNNVIIKEKVHLTVNANGTTTVSFDKFTQECK